MKIKMTAANFCRAFVVLPCLKFALRTNGAGAWFRLRFATPAIEF
jgi:hypothetical protein